MECPQWAEEEERPELGIYACHLLPPIAGRSSRLCMFVLIRINQRHTPLGFLIASSPHFDTSNRI